jgi:hypothetical protein
MENSVRFDDLIRTERYFTATLLPVVLLHNNPSGELEGVRRFVELVDWKATKEHNKDSKQVTKATPNYNDFKAVEVITEFHITNDLKFAGLKLEKVNAEPSEDAEAMRCAPDLVIAAGQELVVCEGKFFLFFHDSDAKNLNKQLSSQRHEVRHLFLNRPIRAYRHVAIVPFVPTTTAIDADVVLTWADIRDLAKELMGPHHYVTNRLGEAVERYNKIIEDVEPRERPGVPNWDGKLPFPDMREKCRELGNNIQVGHVGGEDALLTLSLVEAKKKQWKWRDPETNKGRIIPGNWLPGARWLEIVESTRDFGGEGA